MSILVDGAGDAADARSAGAFSVTATLDPPCGADQRCDPNVGCVYLEGLVCEPALPLPLNGTVSGTTVGAPDDLNGAVPEQLGETLLVVGPELGFQPNRAWRITAGAQIPFVGARRFD